MRTHRFSAPQRAMATIALYTLAAGGILAAILAIRYADSRDARARSVRIDLEAHLREGRLSEASTLFASDSFRLDTASRRDIGIRLARRMTNNPDLGWTAPIDTAGWTTRMGVHHLDLLGLGRTVHANRMDRILAEVATCLEAFPLHAPCLRAGITAGIRQHLWAKVDSFSDTLLRIAPEDLWAQGARGALYLAAFDPDRALGWLPMLQFGYISPYAPTSQGPEYATSLQQFWTPLWYAAWISSGHLRRITDRRKTTDLERFQGLDAILYPMQESAQGWRLLGNRDSFRAHQELADTLRRKLEAIHRSRDQADQAGHPPVPLFAPPLECHTILELHRMLEACRIPGQTRDTTRASWRSTMERLGVRNH
jgi:hypothetical protein